MINSVTFATRLKSIMEYYDLSASSFSEKIDFNRSTISHLLSGRNKPSLEFVLKILENFEEVSFSWLLYGKGNFPLDHIQEKYSSLLPLDSSTKHQKPEPNTEEIKKEKTIQKKSQSLSKEKKIQKIVFFYTDGSFETFEN